MSSPDDRPIDPDEQAAAMKQPVLHETESRLDHVDADQQITPDEVKREQSDPDQTD